jgi:hypothetical protein
MEYEFAPRTKTMTAPIYTKRRRNGSAEGAGGRKALSAMPRNAHTTKQLTRRVLIQLPLPVFSIKINCQNIASLSLPLSFHFFLLLIRLTMMKI